MAVIRVIKNCNVGAPGVADRNFKIGDLVQSFSVYYQPLVWTGNAEATNLPDSTAPTAAFEYSRVVISETEPELAEGLWIQTFPGTDDFTMWIKEL